MTLSGPKVNLEGLEPIELLPASKASTYIQQREIEISQLDGDPLFLVHDGQSGTSDEFLGDAVNAIRSGDGMEGTLFERLMKRLSQGDHTVRIWYARNDPDAHLHVKNCSTYEEAMHEFKKMSEQTPFVNIRARLAV
ncbi:MAG TPA: hypothetical protein VL625_03380 [Patescibacteria group bacterium]|nr:hypothetical protein [Patescibacteria group bacterium]